MEMMNLGELINDYYKECYEKRKEKICSKSEQEKKVKYFSKKLGELFDALYFDGNYFKEGNIKQGVWAIPARARMFFINLLDGLETPESDIEKIRQGRYKKVSPFYLQELVDNLLGYALEEECNSRLSKEIKKRIYVCLDLPLAKVNYRLKEIERVIEYSYYAEDDNLPLETHMELQNIMLEELDRVLMRFSMLYSCLNSEAGYKKLKLASNAIKNLTGYSELKETLENGVKVKQMMKEEYGNNWYFQMKTEDLIRKRYENLQQQLVKENSYMRYINRRVELEKLCKDDEKYTSLEDELEQISLKEGKRKNKERKFIEKKIELLKREEQIAMEHWGCLLECPTEFKSEDSEEIIIDIEKNLKLVNEILMLPDDELKERMLYYSAMEIIENANTLVEDML